MLWFPPRLVGLSCSLVALDRMDTLPSTSLDLPWSQELGLVLSEPLTTNIVTNPFWNNLCQRCPIHPIPGEDIGSRHNHCQCSILWRKCWPGAKAGTGWFFNPLPLEYDHQALTVGVGTVMDAKEVLVLITGANKAFALYKVLIWQIYCYLH